MVAEWPSIPQGQDAFFWTETTVALPRCFPHDIQCGGKVRIASESRSWHTCLQTHGRSRPTSSLECEAYGPRHRTYQGRRVSDLCMAFDVTTAFSVGPPLRVGPPTPPHPVSHPSRPYITAVTQFPFAMWGGGAVDNNSYEWLLKSKNESEWRFKIALGF